MGHSNPLEEKEFDRDAEDGFQANRDNAASTSCHITQEIQPYPKIHCITKKRTRKKQKSSVITNSPC